MEADADRAEGATAAAREQGGPGFLRELGVLDATMIVAGSMIGSGIYIVSADISRQLGCAGWLLAAWLVTGLMTLAGALSYGELASMMPQAGGQYVYLREAYSPLWGFLYGWTLFLVIQTGTIAAVGVAFARFLGVLVPAVSAEVWIVPPIHLSSGYAISVSFQQLVAVASILVLTWLNTQGIRLGKSVQNAVTVTKMATLLGVILLGIFVGRNAGAIAANFGAMWTPRGALETIRPEIPAAPAVGATSGVLGLLVAFCVAQVGSLFSSDAWNNITFAAGEVREPRRTLPLSLAAGTGLVTALYLLANLAYLMVLPIEAIQHAADDRVGTAVLGVIFGPAGATIMAAAIIVSTFGCNNGLVLAGARVYWAMARDGLFFRAAGRLNDRHVPAFGLWFQGAWASLLVLPRTRLAPVSAGGPERYGNLYGNLLDYVVFAVLIFYVLTIGALYVLRLKRPEADRPYRAVGYPVVPALYVAAALTIMTVLALYRSQTTWPGLLIALSGIPVYFAWKRVGERRRSRVSS
jgi:APA family basic amino acid/polyamine antiporter